MVRPSYRANLAGDNDGSPFFGMIFDPSRRGPGRPGRPARRRARAAALHRLADVLRLRADLHRRPGQPQSGDPAEQADRHEDLHAAASTCRSQTIANGVPGDIISLPRGISCVTSRGRSRPARASPGSCGRRCCRRQRRGAAAAAALRLNLDDSTPLWFYVLREARCSATAASTWGRSAAASSARCSSGCSQLDRDSYLSQRGWRPTLPHAERPGHRRLQDGRLPHLRGRGARPAGPVANSRTRGCGAPAAGARGASGPRRSILVEHALDLGRIVGARERQHRQHARLLRVEVVGDDEAALAQARCGAARVRCPPGSTAPPARRAGAPAAARRLSAGVVTPGGSDAETIARAPAATKASMAAPSAPAYDVGDIDARQVGAAAHVELGVGGVPPGRLAGRWRSVRPDPRSRASRGRDCGRSRAGASRPWSPRARPGSRR